MESWPQKKIVRFACERCRRRKTRCSGDLGQGQPCTNCKNAKVEPCLFLRVSSHNIALKPNTSSDNAMSPASLNYGQHPGAVGIGGLPGTAEHPLMAQDGRGYACGRHQAPPPTSHKQDFPATATYAPAPNSYDDPTAVGVGRQFTNYTTAGYSPVHAMPHEIVGMVPSWSSRKTTPYGGVNMDSAPESYGGYGSPSLVHCPAPHSGAHHGHGTHTTEFQSPSFSFSGAASLPTTSTGYGSFDEVDTVASSPVSVAQPICYYEEDLEGLAFADRMLVEEAKDGSPNGSVVGVVDDKADERAKWVEVRYLPSLDILSYVE